MIAVATLCAVCAACAPATSSAGYVESPEFE
jgi:hypothetical protein